MKYFTFLFFLLMNVVHSSDSIDDRAYLKTIPPVSEDTRRWFIPSKKSYWNNWASYSLKSYVRMPIHRKFIGEGIIFYKKKNPLSEPVFTMNQQTLPYWGLFAKDKTPVCFYRTPLKIARSGNVLLCLNKECKVEKLVNKTLSFLDIYSKNKWFLAHKNENELLTNTKCPNDILGGSDNAGHGESRSYIYIPTDVQSTYFETLIDDEKYYVDMTICKKAPKECEVHFGKTAKKFSDYELEWIGLQKQYEKSKSQINDLFSEIADALKKNDLDYLKTMILVDTNHDHYLYESWPKFFDKKISQLPDDFTHELKACIDKKVLSGWGSSQMLFRGKNKICSIRIPEYKIQWIDYPETFMVNLNGENGLILEK